MKTVEPLFHWIIVSEEHKSRHKKFKLAEIEKEKDWRDYHSKKLEVIITYKTGDIISYLLQTIEMPPILIEKQMGDVILKSHSYTLRRNIEIPGTWEIVNMWRYCPN